MSDNRRSFWSSIPGVVTGLAGLLTGVVGLITLLVQLDVIGGDTSQNVATTGTTTVESVPTTVAGVAGGATTVTTEAGTFTVSPTNLNFGPADPKEKTVIIKNTGRTARLTVQNPKMTGKDAALFTVSMGDCNAPLAPNLSCSLPVTFAPSGPLRSYEAKLQIQAIGASSGAEVAVTASTLL
jgi:hypothetical protein